MKKLFVLTSLFALAACGGGSGGGSTSSVTPVVVPDIPAGFRAAVADGDVTSNEYVTKMKSEVVVATQNSNPNKAYLARLPVSMAGDNGFTFTSYRLDDVKFFAADADTTRDGYLNLGLNEDGRIESMKMVVGGSDATPAIERQSSESSTFAAHIYEYVEDDMVYSVAKEDQNASALEAIRVAQNLDDEGYWKVNDGGTVETEDDTWEYYEYGDEAVYRTVGNASTTYADLTALETSESLSGGHWNHTDETLPVGTYGSDIDGHGTKLQYSDFGHFNPVYKTKDVDLSGGSQAGGWEHASTGEHKINDHYAQELAGEDYQLFAGGYAIKGDTMSDERPSLDPVMGATYKGMAVGRVYTDIKFGDGVDDAHRRPYFIANGIGDYDVDSNSDGINDSYSVDIAHDIAKTFVTQNAEMKITRAGGQVVQTLTMPFHTNPVGDKYYDIEIKQTGNTVNYVDFDTDNDAGIAAKYKLYDAENHWDTEHASFNPGYYGVDIATEAAGTATICAPEYSLGGEDGAKRTYEVQAAWGMIKQ